MPGGLPEGRRNVHLTQAIPIDANALQIQVLAKLVLRVLSHLV